MKRFKCEPRPGHRGSRPVEYGLIAEDLEEVYPDLVVHDDEGRPESVQFWRLDVMLLNELQKQRAAIRAQDLQLRAQANKIAGLEAVLDELADLRSRLESLERRRAFER